MKHGKEVIKDEDFFRAAKIFYENAKELYQEDIQQKKRKMGVTQRNRNEEKCTLRLRITPEWSEEIDIRIREEIHVANEFEFYFGVTETLERLKEVSINRELYFSIYLKESNQLIGYLGFSENGDAWEPEIYIFKGHRGKGYGTEALKGMLYELLTEGLVVKMDGKKENVVTERVVSTVRVENIASQRMMEKLGFQKLEKVACCFAGYINPEKEEDSSIFEIVEYAMTKQAFLDE